MSRWSRRPHHYRFRSIWHLDAPPAAVYDALADAESYPRWWPQIIEVGRIDDHTGTARMRSLLPYDLNITARETRNDPVAGVLEITMRGDLEGWARWTVRPWGRGTRAVFAQEVEVRKRLMRWLAVPGRPFFLLNHALMMRAGRRGLEAEIRRQVGWQIWQQI